MARELERKIEIVEEEFKRGELTEFGYRKRKIALSKEVLTKELEEGEITEEGFRRKVARLDQQSNPGPSKSAEDIGKELSNVNPSIKSKISELFNKKGPKKARVPVVTPEVKAGVRKFHRKQVTAVCVDQNTFAVPNRKLRDCLVKEGKIKEFYIGKNENDSEVMEKLSLMFPKYLLEYLKVTGSKDLIPADLSQCGCVLDIVDGANLYVRGELKEKNVKNTGGTHIINSIIVGNTTSSQVRVSHEQPRVLAQVIKAPQHFDTDVLVEELHDDELFHFFREHSNSYQSAERAPVDEDLLEQVIKKRKTLLYKDSEVRQWLRWRQAGDETELESIIEHRDYVEVSTKQMDEFYGFKKTRFSPGTLELPCCKLLEYYINHQKNKFPVLKKYGEDYVVMTTDNVDALCAWIVELRSNPNYVFK